MEQVRIGFIGAGGIANRHLEVRLPRRRLGEGLRLKVEREYSVAVIIEAWKRLFDEVMENARGVAAAD